MNLYLDSTQVESLRNCYETMRHAYPTHQFVFAPVLVPAGETHVAWIEGNYEVHWPVYDDNGVPGFVWVTEDGQVVFTDELPTADTYQP